MNDTPTPLTDAADAEIQTHQTYWDSKYRHLRDFARSLERQIPRWREMKSAPMDRTRVMLYSEIQGQCEGFWSEMWERWLACPDHQGVYATVNNPTHWMPLPEPPKP